MKYTLLILIAMVSKIGFCQSNTSSDFQVKIKFDTSISVTNIKPHYLFTNGNQMENITCKKDTLDNSIVIYGHNDYIFWVSFPVLVFTFTENVKLPLQDKNSEKTTFFYLISKGPLSSYTGEQTKDIHFSKKEPIVVASLEYHNKENAFKDLILTKQLTFSGAYNELYLGNEMITIYEAK